MRIHPLIQIICLLIVVAGVALNVSSVIAAFFILLVCYSITSFHHLRKGLRLAKQLRWFFLSIVILFFWFTPGELVYPGNPYSPGLSGIVLGSQRIACLLLIVLFVNLYLIINPIDKIIPALILLTKPLGIIGFPNERFSVRIALVLMTMNKVDSLFQEIKTTPNSTNHSRIQLITVAKSVGLLYSKVINIAEKEPPTPIVIDQMAFPRGFEWLLPLLLSVLFWNI